MVIKNKNTRYFISAMISTLLLLILFSGFVIVEKNTRYIAFGDTAPFFVYEHSGIKPLFLKIHFMGKDMEISFP